MQAQQRCHVLPTLQQAQLSGTNPFCTASSAGWSPILSLFRLREMQTELSEAVMHLPQPFLDQLWGFHSPPVSLCPAGNDCPSYRSSNKPNPGWSTHWERAGCFLWGLGQNLMGYFCHTSKCHCLAKTQLTLAGGSAGGLATAPRGLSCLQ